MGGLEYSRRVLATRFKSLSLRKSDVGRTMLGTPEVALANLCRQLLRKGPQEGISENRPINRTPRSKRHGCGTLGDSVEMTIG